MDTSKEKRNLANKIVQQTTLPVNEASVQERQVTVQVLTVGTKQVTQALYRQLVEQDILNPFTGLLKGDPWGWVNLHIDCDERREHLHVVWEDKGQLKRARVYKSFETSQHYNALSHDLKFLTKLYACTVALENKSLPNYDKESLDMDVNGYRYSVPLPTAVRQLWNIPAEYKRAKKVVEEYDAKVASGQTTQSTEFDPDGYALSSARSTLANLNSSISGNKQRIHQEFRNTSIIYEGKHIDSRSFSDDSISEILSVLGYIHSLDIYPDIEKKVKELVSITNNWMTSYATIEQQGQLFIAVSGVWK